MKIFLGLVSFLSLSSLWTTLLEESFDLMPPRQKPGLLRVRSGPEEALYIFNADFHLISQVTLAQLCSVFAKLYPKFIVFFFICPQSIPLIFHLYWGDDCLCRVSIFSPCLYLQGTWCLQVLNLWFALCWLFSILAQLSAVSALSEVVPVYLLSTFRLYCHLSSTVVATSILCALFEIF